jgi:uncharacterized Zn finger protein
MTVDSPATICPQCGSRELTFVEHIAAGPVYRCNECGRAMVLRWMPDGAAPATATRQ